MPATEAPSDVIRAHAGLAASRRSEIPSFIVMDVMAAAARAEAAGRRVIHMEVGQPGTPAPKAARDTVARALERDTLGYTLALGSQPLRERIARHYQDWYGVSVPPERVVVTTGSSAGFVLAFLALFDAGERVALPSPGYPCYRHILTALGLTPVVIETNAAGRWMPTAESLAAAADAHGLSGIILASPANPTGTMLTPERLEELAAVARARGLAFVSDEIYHGLAYGMEAETALAHLPDAIVVNSFSKYFSMTGWRVGWMIVPEALVRPIERLAQNLYIAPPAVSQVAALGAFDALPELEANRRLYAANRALLLAELPKLGLGSVLPADGAFYLYADISHMTDDSLAFARTLLEETGIAATPGLDFDEARGSRYLRFSYSAATADIEEALTRLARWSRLKG
jgi:aspartate/methionine/tyrosine aminotransferase